MPGPQKRACGQRSLAHAFGCFRKTKLPRKILRIELGDPLPAKQRVFLAARRREQLRGLGVLLDGFVGMILFLLQEGVSSDALGQLLVLTRLQEPLVDGQSFGLVLRLDEQIEQQAVVNRRAVRLIHACVEIAERLRGFLMLRHLVEHGEIGLDGVLDAVLLEEALGAIQMFAYVCGHPFRLPLR